MAREILMPTLGMYTTEGTVTDWLRSPGDHVEAGEQIIEITTEKATYQIEAPGAGVLHAVVEIGTSLPVQSLIGYILAPGEAPPVAPARPAPGPPASQRSEAPPLTRRPAARPPAPSSSAPLPARPAGVRASPVARRLATRHGIDLAHVTGTGPGGRIIEADVQAAIDAAATTEKVDIAPRGPRVRQRVPLVGMRRTIAERLRHSLSTAAPVTLTREVDAETLVTSRPSLAEQIGGALPFDALFIKLFAIALSERPELNAVIENDAILLLDEVNVGFAVAVPGGLVVPVVHDADRRKLAEVAVAVRDLSERARDGQLQPADVTGGTATITNLGGYGVDGFTPILNPPQSAILGIGRILPRPVVRDGQLIAGQTCFLSLTFDHRVTDGAPAAQLLDLVASLMADEERLAALV